MPYAMYSKKKKKKKKKKRKKLMDPVMFTVAALEIFFFMWEYTYIKYVELTINRLHGENNHT